MPYDARQVANHMLDRADQNGIVVTNLAINKLVYFAHGIYLADFSKSLIKNSFEAWQFGPVVQVLYDAFKTFGNAPITSRARRFNPAENTFVEFPDGLAHEDALI